MLRVGVLAALFGGCQSQSLTFHSSLQTRPLQCPVTRAYWSQDQSGEDQIVLLNDPIDATTTSPAGDALAARNSPPIRQVLVIHFRWRNAISVRGDNPTSDNAVLDWFVYGGGTPGFLHYAGSAHVALATHATNADVDIHRGSLTLVEKSGDFRDPLGSFTVDGKADATNSPGQLRQTLQDLAEATRETKPNRSQTSAPATHAVVPTASSSF